MKLSDTAQTGATIVVVHRVHEGKEAEYERWLDEIGRVSGSFPGHLDWQLVRPVAGLSSTYTVIIRFETDVQLRRWMGSEERGRLLEKVRPLLITDGNYTIRSGLDFWFTSGDATAKVPVRWKQFLITWSAIFPIVLGLSFVVGPALRLSGLPERGAFATLVGSGAAVFLMVYVVMPRYTKLVRKWLFD